MSDLTRYRYNLEQAKESDRHSEHSWAQVQVDDLIHGGVLVPDTTLQQIADAWNELDYKDRHQVRTVAGKLVATIEDGLGDSDDRPV